MVRTSFSSREVISALTSNNFYPVKGGGKGSHTKLRYEHPETGEVRTVIVPHKETIPKGTLYSIMEQAGGKDFQEFCKWIEENS